MRLGYLSEPPPPPPPTSGLRQCAARREGRAGHMRAPMRQARARVGSDAYACCRAMRCGVFLWPDGGGGGAGGCTCTGGFDPPRRGRAWGKGARCACGGHDPRFPEIASRARCTVRHIREWGVNVVRGCEPYSLCAISDVCVCVCVVWLVLDACAVRAGVALGVGASSLTGRLRAPVRSRGFSHGPRGPDGGVVL